MGPASVEMIKASLSDCKTILWNGPLGAQGRTWERAGGQGAQVVQRGRLEEDREGSGWVRFGTGRCSCFQLLSLIFGPALAPLPFCCSPFFLPRRAGVFEMDKFAAGTNAIAKLLADLTGKGAVQRMGLPSGSALGAVRQCVATAVQATAKAPAPTRACPARNCAAHSALQVPSPSSAAVTVWRRWRSWALVTR